MPANATRWDPDPADPLPGPEADPTRPASSTSSRDAPDGGSICAEDAPADVSPVAGAWEAITRLPSVVALAAVLFGAVGLLTSAGADGGRTETPGLVIDGAVVLLGVSLLVLVGAVSALRRLLGATAATAATVPALAELARVAAGGSVTVAVPQAAALTSALLCGLAHAALLRDPVGTAEDGADGTVPSQILAAGAACIGVGLVFSLPAWRASVDPHGTAPPAVAPLTVLALLLIAGGTLLARPSQGCLGWLAGSPRPVRWALAAAVVVTVAMCAAGARGLPGPLVAVACLAVLVVFGVIVARAQTRLEARRVTAEDEVTASHNQLQNLIDNTAAVIYMKRIDNGQYVLVNREWERLFGVNRERVVHCNDQEVFPPALAAELRANDLGVAKAGQTVQFEESPVIGGRLRTYLSVKFPVCDNVGLPYAVCGISTDITERKEAEEEIRRLNAGLETRVRERTAELEASTRELDAFAYSVSHDLRAPLRSLHGFSDALLDDYAEVLDDVGQGYLRRVQHNVQRMGGMIDDLLNLSRATRVDLTREEVDISGLAREILDELAVADPDRRVTTVVGDGLTAYGDPALVRLALHNLLANAWKFTGKRAEARIEVGRKARGGEEQFFVRDNGAGFDMKYAPKLFDAFQRLHPVTDFEGTGIGLATVARIVRRHGGAISAEAEPDNGATFYFNLLPAKDAAP